LTKIKIIAAKPDIVDNAPIGTELFGSRAIEDRCHGPAAGILRQRQTKCSISTLNDPFHELTREFEAAIPAIQSKGIDDANFR
jgi:hypothetical protein